MHSNRRMYIIVGYTLYTFYFRHVEGRIVELTDKRYNSRDLNPHPLTIAVFYMVNRSMDYESLIARGNDAIKA